MLPTLRWFARNEFRHPDIVDGNAARYLDEVRSRFNAPLYITDDARTPDEAPPGASKTSLHYAGRAFDLKWISPATRLARFVESVIIVAGEWGVDYELEVVNSLTDRHIHLGLQLPGTPSEFLVRAE